MSNQLRLLIFIVVISGALCTVQDYVIMSQCAHNKAIYLAPEGKVSVTDIPMTQNITIAGTTDFLSTQVFKITLYAKETKMYLCFNNHWKLVGMKKLQETCYFNESIVHGYFEYRSAVDPNRRVGFTHRGKAIGPKKNVTDACFFFTKIEADRFFHQYTDSFKQHQHNHFHTTPLPSTTSNSPQRQPPSKSTGKPSSSSTLTPLKTSNLVEEPRTISDASRRTTRRKNQRGKQEKGCIHGGTSSARSCGSATVNRQPNGHNSNLSNNSTSNNRRGNNNLSSTNINHRNHHSRNNSHNGNVQQKPAPQIHNFRKHPQSSKHHQVRHHHNNPNFIARRKQYQRDQKMRRLRNSQQQSTNNMQRLKSEEPSSSPVLPLLSILPQLPLSVSGSSQLGDLASFTPSSPGEYNFSLMPARRKARRKKDRMESGKLLGDPNNRRASKEKPFTTPSTLQRLTTKDNLPSSVVNELPLSSLSTKADVNTPSMSSSSTDSTHITFISPTPNALSLSNASVTIDPSPSTQFELFGSSTSIDPWSTTALDDISSSSILSISSFDEVSPTSQPTNDLLLMMESVGNERTDGFSTSTDDYTRSSFSTDSSLDDSYSRSSTINYRNDQYSNDDASGRHILPNHLNNSVTEYQYSTSDSRYVNNSKLKKYYQKYHNGSMGIEKKIEIKSIPISNVSVSGIGTLTTIAATNHKNSNIDSYFKVLNTSSQNYSNTSTERWFLSENSSTTSSNFDDSAFSSKNNQISSNDSTIRITINRTIYNNHLLKSEVKKIYNKRPTIATITTHNPQLRTTGITTSATSTTKVPTKHTSMASYKTNNMNNFYSGEFIDGAVAYEAMSDDELIISETSAGSGGSLLVVGYLPTTASLSSLPESIRIAKIKVNKERRKRLRRKLQVESK